MICLNPKSICVLALAFPLSLAFGLSAGCDGSNPVPCLPELKCPDQGIKQGNASISGLVEIDAFFSSVISISDASAKLEASMKAELRALALALGGEVSANASLEELSAAVKTGFDTNIKANLEGSLKVEAEPAKCEVDVEVVAKASAACDVKAEPGSLKVECKGACEIEASAMAECKGEAEIVCEGKAPELNCEGECTGSCQIKGEAACSGTCEGTCNGECSACLGGTCETMDGKVTNCVGSCSNTCEGTCKLEAAAKCDGKCEGTCRYTPGKAECEADAKVSCQATGEASIQCEGKCEGEVKPPEVKAECKASVEAKASAELRCTPPRVSVNYAFKASVEADARAELKVRLEALKVRAGAILALNKQLIAIGSAAGKLSASAEAAIKKSLDASADAITEGNWQVVGSAKCALNELDDVGDLMGDANASVSASIEAFGSVSTTLGLNP